jgi:hypothetical protein
MQRLTYDQSCVSLVISYLSVTELNSFTALIAHLSH